MESSQSVPNSAPGSPTGSSTIDSRPDPKDGQEEVLESIPEDAPLRMDNSGTYTGYQKEATIEKQLEEPLANSLLSGSGPEERTLGNQTIPEVQSNDEISSMNSSTPARSEIDLPNQNYFNQINLLSDYHSDSSNLESRSTEGSLRPQSNSSGMATGIDFSLPLDLAYSEAKLLDIIAEQFYSNKIHYVNSFSDCDSSQARDLYEPCRELTYRVSAESDDFSFQDFS